MIHPLECELPPNRKHPQTRPIWTVVVIAVLQKEVKRRLESPYMVTLRPISQSLHVSPLETKPYRELHLPWCICVRRSQKL
jgi:hypothetical protein